MKFFVSFLLAELNDLAVFERCFELVIEQSSFQHQVFDLLVGMAWAVRNKREVELVSALPFGPKLSLVCSFVRARWASQKCPGCLFE